MQAKFPLRTQLFSECLGTAMLLCAVIGSGIMAERLSAGNTGLALLANTLATVFALFVLIEILGPVSGAHFNPLVTLVMYFQSKTNGVFNQAFNGYIALLFIAFQLIGAVMGAWLAHAMFDMPLFQISQKLRGAWAANGQFTGFGQWLAETVATAGLMVVILRANAAGVNARSSALVACYIGAAYWFTASTSFANPAAVLGRMLTNSFAGIAPESALGFVAAQIVGAGIGLVVARQLTWKNAQKES